MHFPFPKVNFINMKMHKNKLYKSIILIVGILELEFTYQTKASELWGKKSAPKYTLLN